MIIEFIGCTGAGKTTLISQVQHRLAKTREVLTSFDLVATPLGLREVTHITARNLIQEIVGLPFFIRSLPRHKAFVFFALKMLAYQANFSSLMISNLRSLERKLGMYEIIKRYKRDRMVLVDEGTVLTAHNVFVFTSVLYSPEEIARFASLIPLPDVIVYVRAPMKSLIKRSFERTDRRRELESRDRTLLEKYFNRAVSLFEKLVESEEIQERLLIVDNPESTNVGRDNMADHIAQFILNHKATNQLSNVS